VTVTPVKLAVGLELVDRLLDLRRHAAGVLAGRVGRDRGGGRLIDTADARLVLVSVTVAI
jgi:hypothetical protein